MVREGQVVGEIDPLPLKSKVEEAEAEIDALRHRIAGVATKRPKEAELERARVLEEQAREALDVAGRELEAARAEQVRASKDLVRARESLAGGTGSQEDVDVAEAAEIRAREEVRAGELRLQIRVLEIKGAHLSLVVLEARTRDYDWEEKDYAAQIEAIEASLAALKDDLRRAQITAPVDGIVLRLYQESEQTVAAGTPLLEVGDVRRLEVEADFLSEDVAHMEVGMPAEIFGRALGDRVITGRIRRIYPSAFLKISSLGVEQQRVTVIVGFEPGQVPLGDRYRIEVRVILDSRPDVILVPEGALFRQEGSWHVFLVVDGKLELRAVETGLRDGRQREVLQGLAPGDVVVLHPDDTLEPGTRVR